MRRLVLCAVALSCVRATTREAPSQPPAQAVAVRTPDVEPAAIQEAAAAGEDAEDGEGGGESGGEWAEPPEKTVEAYVGDCHHAFQILDEEVGGLHDECRHLPFNQMCAPDPSGCFDDHEACDAGCPSICTSCNDKCGDRCDGCKAKCGKDTDCLVACAQKRFDCNAQCIEKKENCFARCGDVAGECYESFAEKVAATCDCEAVSDCLGSDDSDDPMARCGKKFRKHPECIEWCIY